MKPTFDSRNAGLLLVAVGWALCLALTGSPEALLFTAPVFLLAAPLALGRYAGEDLIASIGGKIRIRHVGAGAPVPAGHGLTRSSFKGTAPIASNLAGRAPPVSFV